MTRLKAIAHICPRVPHLTTFNDTFRDESIYDTIQDISRLEIFHECFWDSYSCEFITPVLTDEGFCFTFNALNSREVYTNE